MTSPLDKIALETERPFKLILLNPSDGEPIVCTATGKQASVTVYSGDSAVALKQRRSANAKVIKKRGKLSLDDTEENDLNLLTALTVDWYLVNFDGEEIPFPHTDENARELYSNPAYVWIKDQVSVAAGDRANFMKKPSHGQNTISASKQ